MPEYFYVYPAYLAKGSPRSMGRRVPAGEAPVEVTLESIVEAARRMGFKADAEPTKQYPRQFYAYAGRVKVMKKAGISKARFLREIARDLKAHPRSS